MKRPKVGGAQCVCARTSAKIASTTPFVSATTGSSPRRVSDGKSVPASRVTQSTEQFVHT
eukprot:4027167-Prymnesium_polylepis.1